MKFKKITASLGFATLAVAGLTSCGGEEVEDSYTYRTYTSVSPSDWNLLTYQDNNDTQISDYINSNLFEFDYEFDTNGNIVNGGYSVEYSGASKLEDVTTAYAGNTKYAVPASATSGYAYKITLRDDLKWDDGTAIDADDFVYSMREQLNPLFVNYRADSYYNGATVIHNAEDYVKQGNLNTFTVNKIISVEDSNLEAFLTAHGSEKSYINWDYSFGVRYDKATSSWVKAEDKVIESEYTLQELYDIFIGVGAAAIGVSVERATGFFLAEAYLTYILPELDFSEVGIFKGDTDYEVVLVLDNELNLLNSDGSLNYRAAYNMNSLPLVHQATYEACKVAPSTANALWTTTYDTSLETTRSWGPYKLVNFQSGTYYELTRNEYWYGYNMEQYDGQYQTERITCRTYADNSTQRLQFLAGAVDSFSIPVAYAAEFKGSEQTLFTPSSFVGSLQLQSNAQALALRESAGVDKEILANQKFRTAISLGINRADYAVNCTTSSLAGFGIYNSMHYYDVENGGRYRDTNAAKQTLCDVYGVDVSKFASLDDAVASITGYDLTLAKENLTAAYEEELAAGTISANDKVVLTYGTSVINDNVQRQFDFISNAIKTLAQGTVLEGKIELELVDKGDTWATSFRAGEYEICAGGWSGAAWDPGYFLLAYLDPNYMYSQAWATSSETMTFTMPGAGENGADVTDTLTLMGWYNCLNNIAGCKYQWGAGSLDEEKRVLLIAALEKVILEKAYTVPLTNSYSATTISYKIEYISREYNTFMGYGGIRYMTYNYTDAAWDAYVAANGLDY